MSSYDLAQLSSLQCIADLDKLAVKGEHVWLIEDHTVGSPFPFDDVAVPLRKRVAQSVGIEGKCCKTD